MLMLSSALLPPSAKGVILPGAPGGGGTGRGFHLESLLVSPWGIHVSSGCAVTAAPPSWLPTEEFDDEELEGSLNGAG